MRTVRVGDNIVEPADFMNIGPWSNPLRKKAAFYPWMPMSVKGAIEKPAPGPEIKAIRPPRRRVLVGLGKGNRLFKKKGRVRRN